MFTRKCRPPVMAPSANIYSPRSPNTWRCIFSWSAAPVNPCRLKPLEPSNKLRSRPICDYGLTSRKCVSQTVSKVVYEENKARNSQNKCTTSFHISSHIGRSKYISRQRSFNILAESNFSQFEINFVPYKLKKAIVILY